MCTATSALAAIKSATPPMCYRRCRKSPPRARGALRTRLQGLRQGHDGKDDAYASTPLRRNLTLLILIGFSKSYRFNFYGVNTSFLHAGLKEEVYVTPPAERPDGGVMETTFRRNHVVFRSQTTTEQAGRLVLPGKGALHSVPSQSRPRCRATGLHGLVLWRSDTTSYHQAPRTTITKREGDPAPWPHSKGIHLQAPNASNTEMVDLQGLRSGKAVGATATTAPTARQPMTA